MSDFKLHDPGDNTIVRRPVERKKGFADKLIGWGIAKDVRQANMILVGFIVVAFVFIIVLNMRTFAEPDFSAEPVPLDDEMMEI